MARPDSKLPKHASYDADRAAWAQLPQVQKIEHTDKTGKVYEVELVERGVRYLAWVQNRARRSG